MAARIDQNGTTSSQSITIANGGSLSLTGGSGLGGGGHASIWNAGTLQKLQLDAGGAITLTGGGGNNSFASINVNAGTQEITAGSLTITGGTGVNANANVYAGSAVQTIVLSGAQCALHTGDASPIRNGGPPPTDTLKSPSPAKKPTHSPSGEKNGALAPSVPGIAAESKRSSGLRNNRVRPPPSSAEYTMRAPSGESAIAWAVPVSIA